MELPRLRDILAEVPRKPNRYSRKVHRQRQEHLHTWSLIIGVLSGAIVVTLLMIPPPDEAMPSSSASASIVPLSFGGSRDAAREPEVIPTLAPSIRPPSPVSLPQVSVPKPTPKKKSERVQYLIHEVQRGESLSVIARNYRVDWFTLLSVNRLKSSRSIRPGDRIRIPDRKGLLHFVRKDETLEDIALAYDVPLERIISANDLSDPDVLQVNQELFLPDAKIPRYLIRAGRRHSFARGQEEGFSSPRGRRERFVVPVSGSVSSGYGYRTHPISGRWTMHKGVDIASPVGASVRAAKSGVVTFAGPLGGYGNLVVVEHPDGYTTRYAHCSALLVRRGQRVRQGERIARVGDTGYTTGPHLHFEIWRDGSAIDPATILR